jgi:hypothetical protein
MSRLRDTLPSGWPPRQTGVIRRRQSTFWELALSGPVTGLARVHFVNKREWLFADQEFAGVSIFSMHPLLRDYREPWTTLYVMSKAANASWAVGRLRDATLRWSEGLRVFDRYANLSYGVERVLKEGRERFSTAQRRWRRVASRC